jgi:hypothetical protein
MVSERIQGFCEPDEIARNQLGALVDELVKRVLAVGARLAPVNRSCLVIDLHALECDVLAVALHGELLQVGRETL